jgi:hypothetical protein
MQIAIRMGRTRATTDPLAWCDPADPLKTVEHDIDGAHAVAETLSVASTRSFRLRPILDPFLEPSTWHADRLADMDGRQPTVPGHFVGEGSGDAERRGDFRNAEEE